MIISGFAPIRKGIQEHLERGRLNSFDLGIYTRIHLGANYKTGIWWGSAAKLLALAPADWSLRRIQDSLARLEKIGFIRRFYRQGRHGNYAVVINKYELHEGALKGYRLNAAKTTDWHHPAYEPRTDEVTEAAPIKEERSRSKREEAAAATTPAVGEEWEALHMAYPIGGEPFRQAWAASYATRNGQPVSLVMEQCITRCQDNHIPIPGNFFPLKRTIEAKERHGADPYRGREMVKARID